MTCPHDVWQFDMIKNLAAVPNVVVCLLSTLDGPCGSNACTIISLVVGKIFLSKGFSFPLGGQLKQMWYHLDVSCIRVGNHTRMYFTS